MGIADSLRDGVRQGAGQRGRRPAARGRGLRHRERPRQATRSSRSRGGSTSSGFQHLGDRGHRAAPARPRRVPAERVLKVHEGRPNAHRPAACPGEIHLLINTPLGKLTQQDDYAMRRAALQHRVAVHHHDVGRLGRLRRHHRAAEPGRRGALAAGMARAGPRDDRRMGGVTARDPAFAARAPRAWSAARCARTSRSRATRPTGSAGPPRSCCPPVPRTSAVALRAAAAAGVPWFAARARLQHPASRRGARRAGHPARQGARPARTGGRELAVGAGLPGAAGGAADRGGGLGRPAQVRGRAGHGRAAACT